MLIYRCHAPLALVWNVHSAAYCQLDGIMRGRHASSADTLVPCISCIGMRHAFSSFRPLDRVMQGRLAPSADTPVPCISCIGMRHAFSSLLGGVMQGRHASRACAPVPCLSYIGMRYVSNTFTIPVVGYCRGAFISLIYMHTCICNLDCFCSQYLCMHLAGPANSIHMFECGPYSRSGETPLLVIWSPVSPVAPCNFFHLITFSQSPVFRDWTYLLRMCNFQLLFLHIRGSSARIPERFPYPYRYTPSTLDLIFTNEEHMTDDVCIEPPLGNSDHAILKFEFRCRMEEKPPVIKTMFEKGDYNKFMNIINGIPWEAEMNKYPEDINKQWDFFKTKFLEAESLCVPKKRVYIGGKLSKKFSCNLDRKTLRKLKRKNKMWGKIRKNLASDEEKLQYNRILNQIRRLTRKGKKLLKKNIAKESKSNPKRFWKYTQSKLKTRANVPDLQLPGTETSPKFTTSDTEKAEVLLQYFSSVFTVEQPNENMPLFQQGKSEGFESCDRPIVRKRPIWVKISDVLSRVTLKFDG